MKSVARSLAVLLCAGRMAMIAPVEAHHSAAAYYDIRKSVTLTGTIARVDWRNPHVFFYVDAVDRSGNKAMWTLETQSPIALESLGLHRNELKAGDPVTVEIMPALVSARRGRIRVLKYRGHSVVDMGNIGLEAR
jgi:hypothetical protein